MTKKERKEYKKLLKEYNSVRDYDYDDEEPDVDYDRAADDYFSQLSDNLEYNKCK